MEDHRANANPDHPDLRDYVHWHTAYDDPESSLSIRLRHVQRAISTWLAGTAGPVRILSVCAGQGHDILGVLSQCDAVDRSRVSGALVEIEAADNDVARHRIEELDVNLQVVRADAGLTSTYAGLVPADLVLLSGIMGNVSAEDIERLVHTSRQLCAPGATVIWTRGAQGPDLGPDIRRWFLEAGFEEVSCEEWIEGTGMRVGVNRLVAAPEPLVAGETVFTFYR
ncbi:MAG: class I SAM-dependent methyltransferase [Nocardioides sp.]|uniref:class I SAM-dependent methyltransferase n=1 Tax=Nocardioides sp. TaxID=35761 RepID=UPI00239D44C0|nr:class I SAM-dependent methyltransferase [Nocardioides sp.]MDE0777513.1 class I SAM-dependent methyltransferase [Nocardioides sp.]